MHLYPQSLHVMPQNRSYLPTGQTENRSSGSVLFRAAETCDIDLFTCQRPKACLPRALDSPDQHAQEDSELGEQCSELCDLYSTCLTLTKHGGCWCCSPQQLRLNISLLLLNGVHKKAPLTVDLSHPVISGPLLRGLSD